MAAVKGGGSAIAGIKVYLTVLIIADKQQKAPEGAKQYSAWFYGSELPL
jgi:hypothetical protein